MNGQEIPDIVTQILTRRGMAPEEMAAFVYPQYDEHLHDPFLLSDMEPAVARIMAAAEAGERVVVYGDYDIDGITASAVMIEGLAALGLTATSYIPDRFEEGYGINQDALEKLKAQGVGLVISVDCGITSVREAAWAREHGLDLIITDHHAAPPEIPEAIAVINPKRADDGYPFKDLCGAGVAFKVVQALQLRTGKPAAGQEKWLLDLVALGTVCDVVTLVGENRVLASYGLRVMRRTRRVGLRALANVGGVDIAQISAHHLGFVLGPRMNAAGRLEHAARSLELVATSDAARAAAIAEELDVLNRQRRADQDTIFAAADEMAAAYADDPVLLVADPGWSHGVVGIVASKLVEKWQKPVLVAQVMGESTKGSARSYGAFNMVEALRANEGLLTKFGGHFFAAGYTLPTASLDALRVGLNEHFLSSDAQSYEVPVKVADVRLDDLEMADWPLLEHLELLEPYGSGNPRPLLEVPGLVVERLSKIGKDGRHMRLGLRDASGRRLAAIGFGLVARYPEVREGQRLTVLGELNKNEYQGRSSLQLGLSELSHE
ncbi:MAG: single-stranded-DNA-specific exonuclease RecJ [Patescibacteria group bacterium]|nr:single-stranded-DNA-specific exonuclease RecJ [Patescibacteria group bacterium]